MKGAMAKQMFIEVHFKGVMNGPVEGTRDTLTSWFVISSWNYEGH